MRSPATNEVGNLEKAPHGRAGLSLSRLSVLVYPLMAGLLDRYPA